MRNEINLQDRMLAALRQQGQNTTFYLMNGFQTRGIIRGFDNFVVFLESDGKQQMIYKHAISTVTPSHPVQYSSMPSSLVESSDADPAEEEE